MTNKVSFNVLDLMENLHHLSNDCLLDPKFFKENKKDIQRLAKYLNVNEIQAVIFANIFIMDYLDTEIRSVFRYFGMQNHHILKYKEDIDQLLSLRLLRSNQRSHKYTVLYVDEEIVSAISKNIFIPKKNIEEETLVEVLEIFNSISDDFDEEKISAGEFLHSLSQLIEERKKLPFFKHIASFKLNLFETFFLMDTIWDAFIRGHNDYNTDVYRTVEDFYKKASKTVKECSQLVKGEHRLVKLGLIEVSKASIGNNATARLSSSIINFLHEKENIFINSDSEKDIRLLSPLKIEEKQLFYNKDEEEQICDLKNLLEEDRFQILQDTLRKEKMNAGLTVLLHGDPGTGKTESVYQIAKKTGRSVYKVDISETKSMWFGESQKLVKKIFDNYKLMQEKEKQWPILLFNEADGLIGKRSTHANSSVSNTENAIQNILLDELENFEGIFMATTNLVKNMDEAFERRFLYKVQFKKPKKENAAKIWHHKLSFLNEKECLELASQFEFSGGEMENIARKCVMYKILHEKNPNFDEVHSLCINEKWDTDRNRVKIGF